MRTIHSIAELLDCLKQIEREGLEGRREGVRLYYRGEPKDYGNSAGQPGIVRGDWLANHNESNLIRECERRMPNEFAACKSTFECLVKMQHYGIPTRLLDISLDPLVALFFSLYIDPKSKGSYEGDSVVIVYEIPQDLTCNYHSDKVSVVSNIAVYDYDDLNVECLSNDMDCFNKSDSIHHLLHEIRAEKSYFKPEIVKDHLSKVFCVHPLLDNPRIRAQQGAFLLFGLNGNKHHLATLDNSGIYTKKIRIPATAKESLLKELKLLGKTVDNIYPDWAGVSDYLLTFYNRSLEKYYESK